jgi:hypothetical protein
MAGYGQGGYGGGAGDPWYTPGAGAGAGAGPNMGYGPQPGVDPHASLSMGQGMGMGTGMSAAPWSMAPAPAPASFQSIGGGPMAGSIQPMDDDEDYANEPPLLEELGINFEHIYMKTMSVLMPFQVSASDELPQITWLASRQPTYRLCHGCCAFSHKASPSPSL